MLYLFDFKHNIYTYPMENRQGHRAFLFSNLTPTSRVTESVTQRDIFLNIIFGFIRFIIFLNNIK